MKGTQTTLYFSKRHDSDLISLYYQIGRKSFVKIMKEALRVLVRVDYEPKFTKTLNITPYLLESDSDENQPFSIVVSFASEKDVDILNLLSNIKPRKMSAFIKNAMRLLIGPYYVLGCMLEGDTKLNNAYLDRKLFFINGSISTPVVIKSEKPRKVKQNKNKVEESKEEISSIKTDSKPSNLELCDNSNDKNEWVEPLDLPQIEEGESSLIDDDDILSILENM